MRRVFIFHFLINLFDVYVVCLLFLSFFLFALLWQAWKEKMKTNKWDLKRWARRWMHQGRNASGWKWKLEMVKSVSSGLFKWWEKCVLDVSTSLRKSLKKMIRWVVNIYHYVFKLVKSSVNRSTVDLILYEFVNKIERERERGGIKPRH